MFSTEKELVDEVSALVGLFLVVHTLVQFLELRATSDVAQISVSCLSYSACESKSHNHSISLPFSLRIATKNRRHVSMRIFMKVLTVFFELVAESTILPSGHGDCVIKLLQIVVLHDLQPHSRRDAVFLHQNLV